MRAEPIVSVDVGSPDVLVGNVEDGDALVGGWIPAHTRVLPLQQHRARHRHRVQLLALQREQSRLLLAEEVRDPTTPMSWKSVKARLTTRGCWLGSPAAEETLGRGLLRRAPPTVSISHRSSQLSAVSTPPPSESTLPHPFPHPQAVTYLTQHCSSRSDFLFLTRVGENRRISQTEKQKGKVGKKKPILSTGWAGGKRPG